MKKNLIFIILSVTLSITKTNSVLIAVRTPCAQGTLFLTSVQHLCLHCACIMPNISACKPNLLKSIHSCSGQVGLVGQPVTTTSSRGTSTTSATTTSTSTTTTRTTTSASTTTSTTTTPTTTTTRGIDTRATLPAGILPSSFVNTRALVIYFPPN